MNSATQSVEQKTYGNTVNFAVVDAIPDDCQTVLDVGCGTGANARLLTRRGMTVDGVTLSKDEAAEAQSVCRSVTLYNLEHGLPDKLAGPYDCVLCSHVIEHICFPESLLQHINRVLKPGGIIIVALPNLMFWKSRLKLIAGKFDYENGGIWDNTHFRWYTYSSAQRLICAHFQSVSIRAQGVAPLWKFRKFLPEKFAFSIDAWVSRKFPGLFGEQFVLVGKAHLTAELPAL